MKYIKHFRNNDKKKYFYIQLQEFILQFKNFSLYNSVKGSIANNITRKGSWLYLYLVIHSIPHHDF